MAKASLDHFNLGPPSGFSSSKTRTYRLSVDVDADGVLDFWWSKKPADPTDNLDKNDWNSKDDTSDDPKKTKRLNLKIGKSSTWIEIELATERQWYWHKERAVTTASNKTSYYFQLEYYYNNTWNKVGHESCKKVRFAALPFTGGEDEVAFNMNLMIKISEWEFLPLTVDPDIQNPGIRVL